LDSIYYNSKYLILVSNDRKFIKLKSFLKNKKLKYFDKIKIMINISEIIHLCHENNVAHCDLNSQNILINPNLDILLIDFGNSILVNFKKKAYRFNNYKINSYTPPEILMGEPCIRKLIYSKIF
jgi:serine/threonine protein kinase